MTAFETLGIPPTTDLKQIKRAYLEKAKQLHPDQFADQPEIQAQKSELFKELVNAYEQINDEEKLKQYFSSPNAQDSSHIRQTHPRASSSHNQAASSHASDSSTDQLVRAKEGWINLFIPVEINLDTDYLPEHVKPYHFFVTKTTDSSSFIQQFNLDDLAQVIANLLTQEHAQVGTTFDEAKGVVNQHSNRNYIIIVETLVDIKCVIEEKVSELDLTPNLLSGREEKYLTILKNTSVSSSDILSVQPMRIMSGMDDWGDYRNSLRFDPRLTSIKDYWPEDLKAIKSTECGLISVPKEKPAVQANPSSFWSSFKRFIGIEPETTKESPQRTLK